MVILQSAMVVEGVGPNEWESRARTRQKQAPTDNRTKLESGQMRWPVWSRPLAGWRTTNTFPGDAPQTGRADASASQPYKPAHTTTNQQSQKRGHVTCSFSSLQSKTEKIKKIDGIRRSTTLRVARLLSCLVESGQILFQHLLEHVHLFLSLLGQWVVFTACDARNFICALDAPVGLLEIAVTSEQLGQIVEAINKGVVV